jgi:hypothetical protein
MSKVLNANEICGQALRMVGAWPTSETAPLGEHLRQALISLDLIMAENAGVREVFHLVPPTIQVTLTNGEQTYDLRQMLTSQFPSQGIMFPIEASLTLETGTVLPVEIVTRQKWESFPNLQTYGVPAFIYIDRLPTESVLRLWPYPHEDDEQVYKLNLVVQEGAPNLAPSGVTGARAEDTSLTGLRAAWQRYMIFALACDLGNGAINKQALTRLEAWGRERDIAMNKIESFENQEHDTEEPIALGYRTEEYEAQSVYTDHYVTARRWLR